MNDTHRRGRNRVHNGLNPIILSLLYQLYQQLDRSPYKPPVTIAVLALNLFVHLHPAPNVLGHYLADIQGNCLHPAMIVSAWNHGRQLQWHRLFLSSIIHADDMHLYYNMLSLVWKGIHLEQSMGSVIFAMCIIYSLVVSHVLLVLLAYFLFSVVGLEAHTSGYYSCAVGFSAVLFSLKYIWNHHNSQAGNGYSNIMGISFPTQYAAWLELVLISLLSPNASFLGHLAGILAGVFYVHGPVDAVAFLPRHVMRVFRLLLGGNNNIHATSANNNNNNSANNRYTYSSGFARNNNPATASTNTPHHNSTQHDEVEIELEYEEDLPRHQPEDIPDSLGLRQQRLRRFTNNAASSRR